MMRNRFSRILAALLVVILMGSLVLPVVAQRRRSSSSIRSSGTVRVRGYYRKDGTYIRPHYRTRPDGILSNNLSASTNSHHAPLVGTKEYPLGVWVDPINKDLIYNTPLQGVSANYDSTSLIVKEVSPSSRIKKGAIILRYRFTSSPAFSYPTSWADLSAIAMASEEKKITLNGLTSEGKEFTEEVNILGPETFVGPNEPDVESGAGFFVGASHDRGDKPAFINSVEVGSELSAGMKIEGIRTLKQSEFIQITRWSDVEKFLRANPTEEVVLKGTNKDGGAFTLVAKVRKSSLKD